MTAHVQPTLFFAILTDAHNGGLCVSSVGSIAIMAQGKLYTTLTNVTTYFNAVQRVHFYVLKSPKLGAWH